MQNLRILLLQTPTAYWGDSPVLIKRRTVRNLLFYLACQPEIDRTTLCNNFWPDLEEQDSRRILRTTLAKLRAALPDPKIIVATNESVMLAHNRVWVDVREFRELVKLNLHPALQITNQQPLPEALAQQLRRAANLWSANEFWPGADFYNQPDLEDWARDLRQETGYLFQRTLERLAYNAAANGNNELALMRARRALQLDPLNDELHASIFNWLVDSGQRSKAVEHCQAMCDTYKRQGTPLPDQLARLCQTARVMATQKHSAPIDPWPRSLFNARPYINRPEAIQILKQAFSRGGRVLLEGEAGVGKTRLMAEAFRGLEPAPRLILASCHDDKQILPYQAMIRTIRHQILQAEWQALERVWVAQLAHLMPELATIRPDVEPASHRVENEPTLLEAIYQLMLVIARPGKLLFILDDAQWHDPVSLNALSYACQRGFFTQHGLLVVAYRPEEETPVLQQFIAATTPGMPTRRIRLEPFSAEEVGQFTQRMLGQTPSSEVINRLMRETGGNPLFLQESLYLLLNQAPLDINQVGENLPLSGNLQSVAHERLRRLGPTARQVAGVAAVIGNEFMPELLESAGNLPAEQVVQALEELELSRLIQLVKNSVHRQVYTFVYSKIRETILQEMGASRLRMLHLRVARALEKANEPQPASMSTSLAEHYESAGEHHAALQHWLNAGKYAANLYSPAQAHTAFTNAERLLLQLDPAVPQSTVYQLYSSWNKMAAASANPGLLRDINSRLLEIGEKRLSSLLSGTALNGLALAALITEDLDKALQYCDRAGFYLEQTGDVYEQIELNNRRGECLLLLDRFQDGIDSFEKSISLSNNQTDPNLLLLRARAEFSISQAYYGMGWPERTRDMAQRSLKTSLQAQYPGGAMEAHLMLVIAEYYLGNMDEALDHARQGSKLAEALQSMQNIAFLNLTRARSELAQGLLKESWEHTLVAEAIGMKENLRRVLSWAASQRGQTLRFLRQYSPANQAYQAGVDLSVFSYDRLEAQFRLGLGLASQGNIEGGLAVLRTTLEKARPMQLDLVSLLAETSILFIQVQAGMVEEARQGLPGLIERARGRHIAEVDTGAEYIQALLASHDGKQDEAKDHAARVVELGRQYRILWWELLGWINLARLGEVTAADHTRIKHLTAVVSEQGKQVPELAGFVHSYIHWVNGELGYT